MKETIEGAAGRAQVSKPSRRSLLKTAGLGAVALGMQSIADVPLASAQDMSGGANNFYVSERVTVQKVTFRNQYRMEVAGNLLTPRNWTGARRIPRSSWVIPWAR